MTPPRATYRLQFNSDFTFRDALRLVDYLADLGISHLYASPFLKARPGSTHGYDITDHNRINPEIGTDAEFDALVEKLHARGMGLILDFVPNHMGIGNDNAWWQDVLEWGENSPYAAYFDIDWHGSRRDMRGKVLLPVLGNQYGAVLEKGEISLEFDVATGSFRAVYYDHIFPIAPRDYAFLLRRISREGLGQTAGAVLARAVESAEHLAQERGRRGKGAGREEARSLKGMLQAEASADPALAGSLAAAAATFQGEAGNPPSWRPLHALLEAQSYRLAYWRVAAEEINYRRFFNINDLAGLRMELPELFETAHRKVFQWIREGKLQGLRIDHIDGLFDPAAYCRELQAEAGRLSGDEPFYITVEKILARYENLPDWPIAGTTGYEFTNQVAGLFIQQSNERRSSRLYQHVTGRAESFDDVLYASKMRICTVNLASETNLLARSFHELALGDWRTRDFTFLGMHGALCEILAAFPVYRTYVDKDGAGPEDRRFIEWAVAVAKRRSPAGDTSILDFIGGVLLAEETGDPAHHAQRLRLAMRFQQLSGPAMAKGLEDTSFYRYLRLIALNEVGGDPRRFGLSPAAFHRINEDRAKRWPHAMLTTATHDTKRGEDARVRLAILSEIPGEWRRRVGLWLRLNRRWRGEIAEAAAPVRNDEYMFYQAVVGSWPLGLAPTDTEGLRDFAERIAAYMQKAVREGKEQSSWGNPNLDYEAALAHFVKNTLDGGRPNPFVVDLAAFVARLARFAAINALAQTALKLTGPGVPDIYQGCELWDFSLVDPDNRRPVDFALRQRLLAALRQEDPSAPASIAALSGRWEEGLEKLFLTWRVLQYRARLPRLFAEGRYLPLETAGERREQLCAFARGEGADWLVTAVPRLLAGLQGDSDAPNWGDTSLALPEERRWRNILSGQDYGVIGRIAARDLFADFPVALLEA